MTKTIYSQQVGITEENHCIRCGSEEVQFVEFDRIKKRVDEKKILVAELWVCSMCGEEFERVGTLYSPADALRMKLRIAVLSWAGYAIGCLSMFVFLA